MVIYANATHSALSLPHYPHHFTPLRANLVNDIGPGRITAEDLRIDKMRRNFPRMYTQPNFMYKAVGTAGGSDDMCFDHGLDLRFEQARDREEAGERSYFIMFINNYGPNNHRWVVHT